METSLQNTSLTTSQLGDSLATEQVAEEQQHHVHLPNPSLWPFILSAALLVTLAGVLFFPSNPWLTIVAAPFVLVGILGWVLEDPMAAPYDEFAEEYRYVYNPAIPPHTILEEAEAVVEGVITVSSTAYSTHPVKVEVDQVKDDGVILALYGKVELEAQRQRLEESLRYLPNVLDVRNFIVAEDEILTTAYASIEKLKTAGKLDGAQNLRILVENYIVNLYGDVPSSSMRMALEREMLGIPGVRVVVNHIGLNKDIPGNLGKTRNKI
ncbi:MAG: BON domain-containing protein [Chloroflexota bacterium]|nr:BON domain-containing protein [Chloroflexota bacterium]